MNKRFAGFSLIELMVVIAIVAVLAAVAIPAYQTYIVKARLGAVMGTLDGLISQSKVYYNQHGSYPNAKELGLSYQAGNPQQTGNTFPPNSISDYYIQPSIVSLIIAPLASSYSCVAGGVTAYVSNLGDGAYTTSNPSSAIATINIVFADMNSGANSTYCYYTYGNPSTGVNLSGNYLANCLNLVDYPNAFSDEAAFLNSC